MPVAVAAQSIRFRLDEKGAVLKSEGADHPYLALWIANAELMVPAPSRKR